MIKKFYPYLVILLTWVIFSSPFIFNSKIPYPTDNQLNHFALWNVYEKYWSPVKNPATTDIINQLYPWKNLTINSLKSGEIPLWNPYSFSGTPHLANYQSAVFSVTNIFYFIFKFNIAWGMAVLIQPLLAGIFTFIFLRSLKKSNEAGIISAVSFMFCGFITSWMGWTTLSLAISFLPLCFYSIESFFSNKKIMLLPLLGISITLSFLSGHFQTSIYLFCFTILFIIFKLIQTRDKKSTLLTLTFAMLGLSTSFVQILPSLELYKYSVRSELFTKIFPFPKTHLPLFFAPDFYGNPVTRNAFFSNYLEWSVFFGTIPFFLAIYSILKRNYHIVFFSISFIIFLLLSVDTKLIDLLVSLKIPVISTSSISRILVLASFSGAVLAGFGFDQIISDTKEKKYKKIISYLALCASIILLIILYIYSPIFDHRFKTISIKNIILPLIMFISFVFAIGLSLINKKIIKISIFLILTFTIFDMLRFSTKFTSFQNQELIFIKTPIIDELLKFDKKYRTLGPFAAEGSTYFKIPINFGYDSLYIGRYGEFLESINNGKIKPSGRVGVVVPQNGKYFNKSIDFLGIRYIVIKKSDLKKPWVFPIDNFPKNKFKLIHEDKKFLIYENTEALNKAYIVGDYSVAENDQMIIDKILNKNFNFKDSVILERKININENKKRGEVEILEYKLNKIKIKTNTNFDGILVINDNYYPGWNVRVNNINKEILRANYSFRGVEVNKGENVIDLHYFPDSFRFGLYISVLSILLGSIIIFILSKKRPKQ